eukprot:CAMPEP_0181516732 /NCGR_PEP_ID=MMETSP1110-20121109/64301_1 /TAXON_ID=174948 /ORGANISM="Symbiodinium sp., Strain CCMP421" /LENGTH=99 /DNA_ID=CAMNT_0023646909 /DNA_START=26 /DNA_END=322 /DNA_ORIENTATION=+
MNHPVSKGGTTGIREVPSMAPEKSSRFARIIAGPFIRRRLSSTAAAWSTAAWSTAAVWLGIEANEACHDEDRHEGRPLKVVLPEVRGHVDHVQTGRCGR